MKTMKSILVIFVLAVTANIGFAQKNIIVHQNTGENYITHTLAVDSITFQDFATPGTAYCNTYTDSNALVMNSHSKVTWDAQYKGNIGLICGAFDETFSSPSVTVSGLQEVVFSKFLGTPQTTGTLVLTSANNEVREIVINGKGRIDY